MLTASGRMANSIASSMNSLTKTDWVLMAALFQFCLMILPGWREHLDVIGVTVLPVLQSVWSGFPLTFYPSGPYLHLECLLQDRTIALSFCRGPWIF